MTKRHFIVTGVAVFLVSAVALRAQTTTGNVTRAAGEAKVTTEQNRRGGAGRRRPDRRQVEPKGVFRYFDIPPGRQFIIDGQTRMITDLRPGTVLGDCDNHDTAGHVRTPGSSMAPSGTCRATT